MTLIVDLFAGMGGWSEALRDDAEVGVEWDADACRTRIAAGHRTIRADVASYPVNHFGQVVGLIASPPCQTFSSAGNGDGRDDLDRLVWHAHRGLLLETPDPRTGLVLEPLRWIHALRPRWVALEQVPAVAPVWHAYEHHLHTLGYATWSGVCNAADFGVPQTRRRAILLASLDRQPGRPVATHERNPGMFGLLPWVSMADALGWGSSTVNTRGNRRTPGGNEFDAGRSSWALTEKARSWVRTGQRTSTTGGYYRRPGDQPAPTLTGGARSGWQVHTNRGQNPDGTRQTVGTDRPAPSLTGKSGGQWQVRTGNSTKGGTRPGGLSRPLDEPCRTVDGSAGQWKLRPGAQDNATIRGADEPAPSLAFGHDVAQYVWEQTDDDGPIRLTVADALTLQDFPPDYPVQGSRTSQFQQVGNAIPVGLAAAVLAQVIG